MRTYHLPVVFLLVLLISVPVFSQYQGSSRSGGISIGTQFGGGTKNDIRGGLNARGYFRFPHSNIFHGELGITHGDLTGKTYRTQITEGDYRLILSPFPLDSWNIFLYGGIGGVRYNIKEAPKDAPRNLKKQGWTITHPAGMGLQFKLNSFTSLELTGGITYTYSDHLNAVLRKKNDIYWGALGGITVHGEGEDYDSDNDGLSNKVEKQLGTNPRRADSDDDGLSDGDEYFRFKTSLLLDDSDGDALKDGDEVNIYRTNPNLKDSDDDGIEDNDEIAKYSTDPTKWDSDSDGLNDGDEVKKHHTNPAKADTDDDGMSDNDEFLKSRTDPLKADTDGDGLLDGSEVNKSYTSPLLTDSDDDGLSDPEEITKYNTNPMKKDTDYDGLSDGDEILRYRTDPLSLDTDNGGADDSTEVARGTNPNNPTDDMPKIPEPPKLEEKPVEEAKPLEAIIGKTIVLEGIVFKSGSANISSSSSDILTRVLATLMENPEIEVEIHGYTDSVGPRKNNMTLSQARADAVRAYLIKRGIVAARIVAKGFGPDNPIESNETADGRQANRRIEFIRVK